MAFHFVSEDFPVVLNLQAITVFIANVIIIDLNFLVAMKLLFPTYMQVLFSFFAETRNLRSKLNFKMNQCILNLMLVYYCMDKNDGSCVSHRRERSITNNSTDGHLYTIFLCQFCNGIHDYSS